MLSRLSMSVAIAALSVGFTAPRPAIADIGGVTAANPLMEGLADSAGTRALSIGSRVIQNELIVTSADGSGQLLFLDQTTLGIAPSSRLVLDTYVYDPDRSTGKIGLSLTRGALRFIGGRITKLRDAVIGTPAATIGIRGGAVYLDVEDGGTTTVIHLAGERTVIAAAGVQVSLSDPSTKAIIRPGEAPQVVDRVTPAEIDQRFREFEGGGGGLETGLNIATASPLVARNIEPYGSGDLGVEKRPVIATNGGTYDSDALPERERFGLGLTVSPNDVQQARVDEDEGDGGTDAGENDEGNEGDTTETVIGGLVGGVVIASDEPFTAANGAAVTDPEGQNVILGPGQPVGIVEVRAPRFIGIATNGDRYIFPESASTGGFSGGTVTETLGTDATTGSATSGTFPGGTLTGTLETNTATGFTTSHFVTDGGQSGLAFFGTPTPGQLGAAVVSDAIEVRRYTTDAFTGDTFEAIFSDPLTADLTLIEQQGQGFRDQTNALGFAKVSHVVLAFEEGTPGGSENGQSSFLSVGTGRISNSSRGAPLPDLGIYGSMQSAGDTAPTTFEGNGTVIEAGDGSTVFGPDGDHLVFGSGSRFAFADSVDGAGNPVADEDIEATPIRYDTFDGSTVDTNGFLGRADLASTGRVRDTGRLPLGVSYATAVRDAGFNGQNDDTAFTGGYAGGLGISRRDGQNSTPYILRSAGSNGARFSFDASQNEANASLNMVGGASTPSFTAALVSDGGSTTTTLPPDGDDIATVTYNFGSASTRSAMISDRNFALRNRTTEDAGFVPGNTNINGNTGRRSNGIQEAFRGALISNDAAGNASDAIYAGTRPDDSHEYLRWGWWSGEFRFSDDDTSTFADRRERTHLGTWIAGNRLDQSIVAQRRGAATFDGHAVVSVADATGQSISGGSFSMLYDFDEGFGEAKFRDLAGYDFDVSVSGNEGGSSSHYNGRQLGVAGTGGRPDINVGVAGSFFGDSAADSVRATAGQIDMQSVDRTSLRASGIFGGDIVPPRER